MSQGTADGADEARREEARRGRYKSNLTTTFGYVSKDRVKARTGRQLERGRERGKEIERGEQLEDSDNDGDYFYKVFN